MWDFSTEPEFQERLDWINEFMEREVYPLETLELSPHQLEAMTAPLKDQVKEAGLWGAHLIPELGGGGFGQVKYGLMCEILGRSSLGPPIFGNQAPDSGNAEILALFGSAEQKERYLQPLLDGSIRSCFSMTEPGAGADPTLIATSAVRQGNEWVINGHKWFSSHGSIAEFLIVVCVTDPTVSPYKGMSMIIVPRITPGVTILRDVNTMSGDPEHSEILFEDVRVPYESLLGEEGGAFVIAQKRLGPGRIHHVMRWIGKAQRALDMLCERALSRTTHGSLLSEKQTVQNWIADSWTQIQGVRLQTLHAAWIIDNKGSSAARREISAIKFAGAQMLHDVIDRSIQVHGALGFSTDLPLERMYRDARQARLVDGPDEVHRVTLAKLILKSYRPEQEAWPREHVPTRRAAALQRFSDTLEELTLND